MFAPFLMGFFPLSGMVWVFRLSTLKRVRQVFEVALPSSLRTVGTKCRDLRLGAAFIAWGLEQRLVC